MGMQTLWLGIASICIGLFCGDVFGSGGSFDVHIQNWRIGPDFNYSHCCPKGDVSCQYECHLFLKICLMSNMDGGISKCNIGKEPVIIPLLENGILIKNGRDYSIKIEAILRSRFVLLVEFLQKSYTGEFLVIRSRKSEEFSSKSWTTKSWKSSIIQISLSYRFRCKPDFYGTQCDVYCRSKNDIHGHYKCLENGTKQCLPGWTGEHCKTAICEKGCTNNGWCVAPNTCECKFGLNGTRCEECSPLPGCVHGRCQVKNGAKIPFSCECSGTWNGFFCNIDGSYCQNHNATCLNGGKCTNLASLQENKEYKCTCLKGFSGTHCEKAAEDCVIHGCSSHGVCQKHSSPRRCLCQKGYYGARCQFNQTKCEEKPCQAPNSICLSRVDGFKCQCPSGFTGRNCEIDIDECQSSPCQNGGACVDRPNGYECVCPVGYVGARCHINQDDCHNLSCANGGHCRDLANSIACNCPIGFTGRFCEENIDECRQIQPCLNGGTCIDTFGSFECLCPPGYHGPKCFGTILDKSLCSKLNCQNGGRCEIARNSSSSVYCKCSEGFFGERCEKGSSQYVNIILIGLMAVLLPLVLTLIAILAFIFIRRRRRHRAFRLTHQTVNNKLNSEHCQEEGGRKLINSSFKVNNCSPMGTPYSLHYNQMYPDNTTTSSTASRYYCGRPVGTDRVDFHSKEGLHELDYYRNSSVDLKNSYPSLTRKSRKMSDDSMNRNLENAAPMIAMKHRSRVNSMSQSTLQRMPHDKSFQNVPMMMMYSVDSFPNEPNSHFEEFHPHRRSSNNIDQPHGRIYASPPPPYTLAPSSSRFSNSNLHTACITPMPLPRSRSINSDIRYMPGSNQITQV